MAKKFLTLNIGADTVSLAEYSGTSSRDLTLVKYGVAQLAAPLDHGNVEAVLSPALLELVREKGIKPGKVAVSISGQMVFPRFAEIPFSDNAEKFDQQVRYEIEQNVPFPIDEMICDHQVLGETEAGEKSVLIVAAKIDQVEPITSAMGAVGFVPTLVDVAPLALTNALHFARPDEGCVVMLDIGAKTTSLVIIEGDHIYNRSIPIAGSLITKEISGALGCTIDEAEQVKLEKGYVSMGGVTEDADEVADRVSKACRAVLTRLGAEVSRSINFYRSQQGGSAPQRLYLTGGTALLPQIDQFFGELLGVETEFFNPFEAVNVAGNIDAESFDADIFRVSATVGLALHQLEASFFAINLLPPAIVEARAERARIPVLVAAGLLVVLGLGLIIVSFSRDEEILSARRDLVLSEVSSLEKMNRKLQQVDVEFQDCLKGAENLRRLLMSRSAANQHLNAVRESLLPGMWIERWDSNRITIRYWADRVKAESGKTKTVGEGVVEKLKGKMCVDKDSVKITDMSSIGKDAHLAQVTIELKFK